MLCRKESQGFTLAEMAIVVVIASILLVAGVKVMTAQMESASYGATRSKQEAIKQSLITYLGKNKRLPCPDSSNGNGPGALSFSTAAPPDGIENRATAGDPTSNCARTFGVLPYATLGLSRDTALDGWSNLFSYHLSTTPNNWALTTSFAVANTGSITVNERDNVGAIAQLTSVAVVSIISHGKNSSGAFTIMGTRATLPVAGTNPDERENVDADTVYFKREYTNNSAASGGAFDDLVLYLMADDLIAPLQRDGTFRTPVALVNEQLADIKNAIVGSMMGAVSCNTPISIASLSMSASDPWGTAITYTRNITTLKASDSGLVPSGNTGASTAFTLNSNGPDRAVGGGDDFPLSQTVGQMRGLLGTAYATRCP